MKGRDFLRRKQRKYRGLAALSAVLLVFVLAAQPVVNSFRTDIDKFLGTVSVKRVSGSEGGFLCAVHLQFGL